MLEKSEKRILILNLGSTSTKVAVYVGGQRLFSESIEHPSHELEKFKSVWEQQEYRKGAILEKIREKGIDLKSIDVISCRGSNIRPVPSGIYFVNEKMVEDMRSGKYGLHANNVGGCIAFELGRDLNIPVITLDPPKTDEFENLARYSGLALISRVSSFHALNQKSTARKVAAQLGKRYEDINLIVAHLGGGISVGAHKNGRVIDANNALDGDGPFSPERTGSLPVGALVRLCFSGQYSQDEILKMITGKGGLVSYLGTNSGREVEKRISAGDQHALEVFEAMAYQVSKEIGAAATVLKGRVDAIAITGSLANSERLVGFIRERVAFIAPIFVCPGENEIEALAEGALRFLNGEEGAREY